MIMTSTSSAIPTAVITEPEKDNVEQQDLNDHPVKGWHPDRFMFFFFQLAYGSLLLPCIADNPEYQVTAADTLCPAQRTALFHTHDPAER